MSAELAVTPEGKERHPWGWNVDEPWVTERFIDFAPVDLDVPIVDPCCGMGNVVRTLTGRGAVAYGMDMFDRGAPHFLGIHNFLGDQRAIYESFPRRSIVFNPPFSFQDGKLVRGLAEQCIRRALEIATDQVAALLPVKWLASEGRYHFYSEMPPRGCWILSERPSMPPGDQIEALGNEAYKRGKVDYMWLLWDKTVPPAVDERGHSFVPTYWIPKRDKEALANVA